MSNKKTVIEEQLNGIWTFIYPPEVEMVVVSGDIHGAFREIVNKVACQYNIQNALVIIAGDCGFGFEREGYYENIYQRCSKHLKKNFLLRTLNIKTGLVQKSLWLQQKTEKHFTNALLAEP